MYKQAADRWRFNAVFQGSQDYVIFGLVCVYHQYILHSNIILLFVPTRQRVCAYVRARLMYFIAYDKLQGVRYNGSANDKNSARRQDMSNSNLLGAFVCLLQVECCAPLPRLFLRHAGMSYS